MKRIIFYAAAVGIFVSSVLAKPARGASPGEEWFPGQGSWMAEEPGVNGTGVQTPGTEWFPGQGPWMVEEPEANGTEVQTPGTEWFPGQGPWMAEESEMNGSGTQPQETLPDLWGNCFPWQEFLQEWQPGGSHSFWLFDGSAQGNAGNSGGWQQDGQNDLWWFGGADHWNIGGGQSGGQSGNSGGWQQGTDTPGQPGSGWQSGGSSGLSSYVTRIVELVNEQRAAAGLSPVTASAELSAAADVRAQEIVGGFSHYRPNGTYFNTVLDQRGVSYNGAGENIAYGYDTPERVMSEWMNSPGHRANILDSRYTKLGVGYYESGGVKYWTQMFTY